MNIKLLYFKILLIHGNEEINYVEQFNYCCISFRYFFISDSFYLQHCSIINPELQQSDFFKMYKFQIKKKRFLTQHRNIQCRQYSLIVTYFRI